MKYRPELEKISIGLFYDDVRNIFTDEGGFMVFNIYDYITPNDLLLFRVEKDYMLVQHRHQKDYVVELYYPDHDD